jgi:gamma-glutamyltranspeptidase / glutathione hydrolase
MRRNALPWLAASSLVLALALAAACKRATERSADPAPAPPPPAVAEIETGPDDGGDRPAASGTQVATGRHGAVTSAEGHATRIGLEILKQGGNAVDAAIAIGFALGVTHPSAGNIGGGGFMIIRLPDGRSAALDFREVAPGRATRTMYLDAKGNLTDESRRGPRAAGIPGNVAGFALAHEKYGSLPWKELVMPAVALARDGHPLDHSHAEDLRWGSRAAALYLAELGKNKRGNKALREAVRKTLALWRRPDGAELQAGDVWVQPELATTLEAIAERGADAFYRGPLARTMAAEVSRMGGLWTEKDLAGYRAIERQPITFEHRGHRVTTMPPPSAGGVTLRQIMAASEILGLHQLPWDSPDRIHLYVEALRRVFADRNLLIADPDFVEVPLATLLDVTYLAGRMADVKRDRVTPSTEVGAGLELKESAQTTHFSVVDGQGMAVANTYTLNGGFGAKVVIPGTGVTLNNEMDDFTAKVGAPNMFGLVQGAQNAIEPGKRMVSSMTPTIVEKAGAIRAVCGSPGGPTIITTVAQVLLQVLDHGRTLDQAIAAPRVHHQWLPDQIRHEDSLDPAIARALAERGHALRSRGTIGHANCIEVDPRSGAMRAVADTGRDGGEAAAY